MKNKKLAIFMLVSGILLVVSGIITFICKEISDMNKEKKEIETNITNNYEKFRQDSEKFENIRNTYYSDVANNLFPETVKDNYQNWILVLDEYTTIVDSAEKNSYYLKEKCIDKYYPNQDIKNKCDSFIIAYETLINYYTKDIISFNNVINEYYTKNEINKEESEIKEYTLKYNYMDINSDGEFKGKD